MVGKLYVLVKYIIIMLFLCIIVNCGRVKRIIGGHELECGSQPRVASLRNSSNLKHLCGVTLLSPYAAVTAAHCMFASPSDYILQLNNYCTGDEDPPKATVLNVYKHKLYDKYSRAHDIAILAIDLDLDDVNWLNEDILPTNTFGISGGECMIAGYGIKDVYSNETSEVLLGGNVKLISLDQCYERLGTYVAPSRDSGMVCAVGVDCADSCQGDSGGPILCTDSIIGVSSYGQSCGVPNLPGVYTNVGAHIKWIKNILEDIDDFYNNL